MAQKPAQLLISIQNLRRDAAEALTKNEIDKNQLSDININLDNAAQLTDRGDIAQAQSLYKTAKSILTGEDVVAHVAPKKDPRLKFQHEYIGNHPVDYKTAQDHLNTRIDGVEGSLQRVIDIGGQALIKVMDRENANNFNREFNSFKLFIKVIENTITTQMSDDPEVYKILMNTLKNMVDRARLEFNKKFDRARHTHKWFGGSAKNLQKLTELSIALIKAKEELEAKQIAEMIANAEDLYVIADDEPEPKLEPLPPMSEPAAEPVAEEDFSTKIKNIFAESFDRSYKKAIKKSLEDEQ